MILYSIYWERTLFAFQVLCPSLNSILQRYKWKKENYFSPFLARKGSLTIMQESLQGLLQPAHAMLQATSSITLGSTTVTMVVVSLFP